MGYGSFSFDRHLEVSHLEFSRSSHNIRLNTYLICLKLNTAIQMAAILDFINASNFILGLVLHVATPLESSQMHELIRRLISGHSNEQEIQLM